MQWLSDKILINMCVYLLFSVFEGEYEVVKLFKISREYLQEDIKNCLLRKAAFYVLALDDLAPRTNQSFMK